MMAVERRVMLPGLLPGLLPIGLYTNRAIPPCPEPLGKPSGNGPKAPKHTGEIYMRIGILISCSSNDSDEIIESIKTLVRNKDSKVVYILKSHNEIRLIEKPLSSGDWPVQINNNKEEEEI